MYQPLADELRPNSLEDVVGQGHILAGDAIHGGEIAADDNFAIGLNGERIH